MSISILSIVVICNDDLHNYNTSNLVQIDIMITSQLTIVFCLLCLQLSNALLVSSPSATISPHTYRLGFRSSVVVNKRFATKTSLSLTPEDASSILLSSNDDTVLKSLAEGLGYHRGSIYLTIYSNCRTNHKNKKR